MLFCKDCCRGENCDLFVVHDRFERRAERHFRFAVADVAADKPVHHAPFFHIVLDFADGAILVVGQVVFEIFLEFALPRRIGGIFISFLLFAFLIKFQQVEGKFTYRRLRFFFGFFEFVAAEFIEFRRFSARKLRQHIHLVDGHEKFSSVAVTKHDVIARYPVDGDAVGAFANADSVLLVNNIISRF